MAKRLFLLLIISLFQIIITPGFLMADNLSVKSPGDTAVLTVLPEPEPEPEPEPKATYAKSVYRAPAPAPVYVAPAITNYTVSYYINTATEYNNTAYSLRYDGIYKFRKMIYGHNTYNLLGSLSNRYVGETFTITEGGVAKNYVVTGVQTYQKTSDGFLNGDAGLMNRIANSALGYDIALLTCSGVSYGNGDASHRLVVFANAI